MRGNSLLALVLMLCAACSVGTARLSAWDDPDGLFPYLYPEGRAEGVASGFSESPDLFLRRLPPPDDSPGVDDSLLASDPRENSRVVRPLGEDSRTPFAARLFWIPTQELKNGTGELAMSSEEIDLAFPLRIDSDGMWLAMGSVGRLEISTAAVLPDSGLPVPDQFWDIEVGAMHNREFANGWRGGGMFRVGSPSDRPFAELRDMTVTVLGFLTIPHGERDAWSLSLFYSPTGQIIFPVPGVAYVWRPSDRFQANLGIPLALAYQPTETLTLTASYRPLTDVQVLARQNLGENWSIYGGYRTVNKTFLLADRLEDSERTYFFDQRLTLGVQRELGWRWSVDLSAAYVFDRKMFQAEKFSGSRRDELAIDPGVAGTLQLLWTR